MTTFKDALAPLAARMRPVRSEREVLRVFGTLQTQTDSHDSLDPVRNQVLRWVNKRCGPLPDEAWQFRSFEKFRGGANAHCVSIRQPETDFWALRADDSDKTVAGRVWSTEITVGRAAGQPAGFSCRLLVSATEDKFSYSPAVPGVVRQIADEFTLHNAGLTLRSKPESIADAPSFDSLLEQLEDPSRRIPIVVFTTPDGHDMPLLDVAELSGKLVGLAQFVVLSGDYTWKLTEAFGKQRSIFGGGFRAYLPGFSTTETPYRHPLVVPQHLQTDSQKKRAVQNLADTLARQSNLGSRLGIDVPTFSNVRLTSSQLARAESRTDRTDTQKLADVEELNNVLMAELESNKQQHEDEVEYFSAEHGKAEQRAEEAEFNLFAAQARIEHLTGLLNARGQSAEEQTATPDNWPAFADWVDRNFAGRVALTPVARKELKKALFEDIDLACRCIVWLAKEHREARLSEVSAIANNEVVESGIKNSRCGGDTYEVQWQGQGYEADWHIKNGGNTRSPERCFRIYYFWDGDQIVITHMPSHRKTSMS